MDALTALRSCLREHDPLSSLRQTVTCLFADGLSKETVVGSLEMLRRELQDGESELEDSILDVMDFVVGWCSPHMRLG